MGNINISLPGIEDVKAFSAMIKDFDFDAELISDKYVVNAKSIMGIFSLDLSKPIELRTEAEPDEAFKKALEPFLAK